MKWQELYTSIRSANQKKGSNNPDQVRTSFIRDYDRLIFSSAFRRLQNKTQVFPLPGAVFVHNRLTHSLEVASVGRSLGKMVGETIAKNHDGDENFKEFYKYELSSVIAAACLAHDIGNPPFGHSGEDAIRTFFLEMDSRQQKIIQENISENQWKDFEFFEGNANAFRTLTHPFNEEKSSYQLTYTTLASIVKYPCTSIEGFHKKTGLMATKKSGFFDSELSSFQHIAETFKIPLQENYQTVYARHPFVFLTEAADDICYRIMDLEDAHRLNIIGLQEFENLFLPFFEEETGFNHIDNIHAQLQKIIDGNQKVQYIRARWIGLMVYKLAKAFMANEQALLEGSLQKDLLHCLSEKEQGLIEKINAFSFQHVYNYRSVIEIESAGFNIIGGLLKAFVKAVLYPKELRSEKLLQLIPEQYTVKGGHKNIYPDLLSVTDYISGMTDLYALDIYRKITGIAIPDIR